MSFLYRAALTVTRKQPYIDWANGLGDDGPELTLDLVADRRTIYLVPESDDEPDLKALVEEFWAAIFEEELAAWMLDDKTWPDPPCRRHSEKHSGRTDRARRPYSPDITAGMISS